MKLNSTGMFARSLLFFGTLFAPIMSALRVSVVRYCQFEFHQVTASSLPMLLMNLAVPVVVSL